MDLISKITSLTPYLRKPLIIIISIKFFFYWNRFLLKNDASVSVGTQHFFLCSLETPLYRPWRTAKCESYPFLMVTKSFNSRQNLLKAGIIVPKYYLISIAEGGAGN